MITADFSGQVLVALDQVGVAFSRLILDPARALDVGADKPRHEGRNTRRRCGFRLPRRLDRRAGSLLLSPDARIDQLSAKLAKRDSRPMANVYPVAIHQRHPGVRRHLDRTVVDRRPVSRTGVDQSVTALGLTLEPHMAMRDAHVFLWSRQVDLWRDTTAAAMPSDQHFTFGEGVVAAIVMDGEEGVGRCDGIEVRRSAEAMAIHGREDGLTDGSGRATSLRVLMRRPHRSQYSGSREA